MLAGREYAKGSSDCPRCEMHSKSLEFRECGTCGERGCEFCIESREYGTCSETGYRDGEYLCGDCASRKDYPRDKAIDDEIDRRRCA